MLVYGIPGAGKTRLAGSGESKTLIVRPPTDHTDSIDAGANVDEMVIRDWSDQLEAFQFIQQGGGKDYGWIWLDSISLWQDHGLDDVFAAAIARKESRKEFGPDQGEYGINMTRLTKWIRDMVALADMGMFNFGITAHPFEWYDPVREEDVWAPWIQGKNMSPKICGYMNVVAYLSEVRREGKKPTRLLVSDAAGHVGKDQFNCFPELKSGRHGFVDPTMTDIEAAIKKARRSKPTAGGRKRPARKRR